MAKQKRNTKGKIIAAAWELFYEQGYEDTTVEEIIAESQTSKGSFYHYFEGKDALLSSLSYLFDEKYEQLQENITPGVNTVQTLLILNHELFSMIENAIDPELIKKLYSTQLVTKSEKQLLDHNRVYFKLLRRIITEGQQRGELTDALTVGEMVRLYAMTERAMLYEWCLRNGEYALADYAGRMLPLMLSALKK